IAGTVGLEDGEHILTEPGAAVPAGPVEGTGHHALLLALLKHHANRNGHGATVPPPTDTRPPSRWRYPDKRARRGASRTSRSAVPALVRIPGRVCGAGSPPHRARASPATPVAAPTIRPRKPDQRRWSQSDPSAP